VEVLESKSGDKTVDTFDFLQHVTAKGPSKSNISDEIYTNKISVSDVIRVIARSVSAQYESV